MTMHRKLKSTERVRDFTEREAAFVSFFRNEGSSLPGADGLLKMARRRQQAAQGGIDDQHHHARFGEREKIAPLSRKDRRHRDGRRGHWMAL